MRPWAQGEEEDGDGISRCDARCSPWLAPLVGALAILCVAGLSACTGSSPPSTPEISAVVEGYLVVFPNEKKGDDQGRDLSDGIFVPNAAVRIKNVDSGDVSDPVQTDLSGRFLFPPQKTGAYQVCWEADGFESDCRSFDVVDADVNFGPIAISVANTDDATIFGSVRFADGSLTRKLNSLANVNAFATVDAATAGGGAPEVYVNNDGDYIIPQVDRGGVVDLKARIEHAGDVVSVNASAIPVGAAKRVDITLPNSPPEMKGLVASAPGNAHWTVHPGDHVEITARAEDPDGDSVEYRWILPDGSSEQPPGNGQTLDFDVPDLPGQYEFMAIASDGNGGYVDERIVLSTKGVRFSGTVTATDAPTVSGAEVEINGKTATTNAEGFFQMFVDESSRYVMNIRKSGYGLVSKIYDNSVLGGRWTLTRASVTTLDPTTGGEVENKRQPSDCPGALGDRDPKDEKNDRGDCGPGIAIRIPADALVDEDGNPPVGMVEVELTTNDLRSPDGMQGDYTAMTSTGDVRVMETYGAGTVEITGGSHSYNLAPGATATIRIPIDPAQLAAGSPAPTVPLLSYDEQQGVWVEEGVLTLSGDSYVGEVSHFSAINADALKVNQACVRIEATVMPPQFNLEATIPSSSGGANSVRTVLIDNASRRFHVIYNLPTNANLGLRVFLPGSTTPLPLLDAGASTTTITAPTGGPQNPTTPNLPEFPYTACDKFVELIPFRLPAATQDQFLAGLFSFNASNLNELDALDPTTAATVRQAAEDYYDTIDPQGLREDLQEFKDHNGFGAGEVTATYANSADLGFGREMHCKKTGLDVACYVTNYGNRFTRDSDDFALAVNRTTPVATVGMEYSRVENASGSGFQSPSRFVKFYVFKEALASTATPTPNPPRGNGRAISANLDGYGERPVPGLCAVCHGGQLPAPATGGPPGAPGWVTSNGLTGNIRSNFIPFDLSGLTLPVLGGTDYKATQQTNFRDLNWQIVMSTDPPLATQEVIQAMYPGGASTSTPQVEGAFVAGWSGATASANVPSEQDVYENVVSPSCRTCHVSRGQPGSSGVGSAIDWNTATEFLGDAPFIASLVCDQHKMPHAVVTHNRFWLSSSPHQPLKLHDFLNGSTAAGTGTGLGCFPSP